MKPEILEHDLKAVLFDLDGTLLDTRDLILASMRYAYTTVLGAETLPSDQDFLSLVGIPLKTQMEMLAAERSQEMFDAYLKRNDQIQDKLLKGFDGTAATLLALQEQGYRMAVVTSKRHVAAMNGLAHIGLAAYFEFLLGADDTSEHKPQPGPLLDAAAIMDLEPEECTYLGDSAYDMLAARAANMFAVGALWGMSTPEALAEAGAEILISHISQLPDAILNFPMP